MREFIGDRISIDGRMIEYRLVTASDYLRAKYDYTEEELEDFYEKNYKICEVINQVMALKQSCYVMRRVSYSCGSISESLYNLKERLIIELHEKHSFEFDDDLVDNYK